MSNAACHTADAVSHPSLVSQNGSGVWQVTDISQYGDIAAAQSVLVPPGCKVLDKSTFKVPQPSRNTGTLAGVVKVPPSTIYRYTQDQYYHSTPYALRLAALPHYLSMLTDLACCVTTAPYTGRQVSDATVL